MTPVDIGAGISQYFVDEDGNVYWQYQSRFKLMVSRLNTTGYPYILIDGHKRLVHRLIAKAFLPNPDNKPCVNHVDGNKINNAVSNLEWVTHSENMRHAFDSGIYPARKGSKQNNAKLTEPIVAEIKRRLLAGDNSVKIAKEHGVSHGRIYDIKHGRSWAHVDAAKKASGLA